MVKKKLFVVKQSFGRDDVWVTKVYAEPKHDKFCADNNSKNLLSEWKKVGLHYVTVRECFINNSLITVEILVVDSRNTTV